MVWCCVATLRFFPPDFRTRSYQLFRIMIIIISTSEIFTKITNEDCFSSLFNCLHPYRRVEVWMVLHNSVLSVLLHHKHQAIIKWVRKCMTSSLPGRIRKWKCGQKFMRYIILVVCKRISGDDWSQTECAFLRIGHRNHLLTFSNMVNWMLCCHINFLSLNCILWIKRGYFNLPPPRTLLHITSSFKMRWYKLIMNTQRVKS